MKKYILLLMLIPMTFVAKSQVGVFSQTASNPTGAIVNTSVDTMTYRLSQSYRSVSVMVTVTRTANTMAGTAIVQHSPDGIKYFVNAGDTLTLTNSASQSYLLDKTSPCMYWRVITGGATTVTATVAGKITASR